jgi:outer membrane murein-binding lipoprotein Lpp
MTFSWDFNVAALTAIMVLITAVMGHIVAVTIYMVKTNNKATAAIDLAVKVERLVNDAHDALDTMRRQFGETVAALKERMNLEVAVLRKESTDDQKYVRDEFVRRESFYKLTDSLQQEMRSLGDKLDKCILRMDEKIDRARAT